MVSLRYALTKEDFVNFSIYVQLEAPGKKNIILKALRPAIIIFSAIVLINITTAILSRNLEFVDFIGIPVLLFLIFYPMLSAKPRLRKQALKFAANNENAAVFNMQDYIFSETGILVKDPTKETKFQWTALIKKQETAEYFYLFLHSTSALIIPKKVLRSEVEKGQLQRLFAQYISFDAEVGHLVSV